MGGSQDAVYVTDDIPNFAAGITTASVTSANPQFTCTIDAGGYLECRLNNSETFANGATEIFTIEASRPFAAGAVHSNTAFVSSSSMGETAPANNTSGTTTINVEAPGALADVEMTGKTITPGGSAGNPVNAGAEATYVLSFKNHGTSDADNVTIQDVFSPPAGRNYTVVSVSPSAGTCDAFGSNAANTLDCSIGTMIQDQAESVTVVLRPEWDVANTGWTMDNTATVSTTTNQGANVQPDSKTATLNVIPAEIDLLVNDTDLADSQ